MSVRGVCGAGVVLSLLLLPLPAWGVSFDQKAALVDRILAQGASPEALSKRQMAQKAWDGGDQAQAMALLDEAIRLVNRGSKVGSPAQDALVARQYEKTLATVQAFRHTYGGHWQRLGASGPPPLDLDLVDRRIQQAQEQARGGAPQDAVSALKGIRGELVAGIARLLGSTTVVYGLDFKTPVDEYRYEVERYKGLSALLQWALAQGDQDPARRQLVDKYRKAAQDALGAAEAEAASAAHASAVKNMEAANDHLSRALRAAGLALP